MRFTLLVAALASLTLARPLVDDYQFVDITKAKKTAEKKKPAKKEVAKKNPSGPPSET